MKLQRKLLAFFSQCDISALLLKEPSQLANWFAKSACERYESGEVLEYILGCAEFAGMWWACDKSTLVPRDDSLVLLELVAKELATNKAARCLEIGAGTGILSLSLELACKGRFDESYFTKPLHLAGCAASFSACDISADALKIAQINKAAKRCECELIHSDFKALDFSKYDVVFSNPPYIANDYALDKRVRQEPATALFGGEKGSEILEQIIAKAASEGLKVLACEIGYDQADLCEELLNKAGFKSEFALDLAGFKRAFIARKIH